MQVAATRALAMPASIPHGHPLEACHAWPNVEDVASEEDIEDERMAAYLQWNGPQPIGTKQDTFNLHAKDNPVCSGRLP